MRKKIIKLLLAFLIIKGYAYSSSISYNEVIAYRIYGKAYRITSKGKKIRIHIKDKLYKGDTIMTTPHSELILAFISKTPILVKIKGGSKVKLIKIEDKKVLEIKNGGIFSKLRKLKRNESFLVNTPSIVAGVRGTEFVVEVKDKNHDNKKDTTLITTEGKVEVKRKQNPSEKVYVDKDKKVEELNNILAKLTPRAISKREKKKIYKIYGIKAIRQLYKKAVKEIEKRYKEAIKRIEKSYQNTEKKIDTSFKEIEGRIDRR